LCKILCNHESNHWFCLHLQCNRLWLHWIWKWRLWFRLLDINRLHFMFRHTSSGCSSDVHPSGSTACVFFLFFFNCSFIESTRWALNISHTNMNFLNKALSHLFHMFSTHWWRIFSSTHPVLGWQWWHHWAVFFLLAVSST